MRLIAHHNAAVSEPIHQAVIVHDDGTMYFYRIATNLADYHRVEDTDPVLVEPDNWEVDNLDFENFTEIRKHLIEVRHDS